MAFTFPRDMLQGIDWHLPEITLQFRQEFSQTPVQIDTKDLAPPLWRFRFRSHPMRWREAEKHKPVFEALRGSVNPFYVHPACFGRPYAYGGENLSAVTVAALPADNRSVRLTGLPEGFTLTAGDYLSIVTANGVPTLFQVAQGSTAGIAGGLTITVNPYLRPIFAVGDAVELINPRCKVKLVPDGLSFPRPSVGYGEIVFEAVQVPK